MGIAVASPRVHERNLAARPSPILSDGAALSSLIDFDKREVKLRVLNDAELHRMELKRVFARSWIIVGHASEIPNAGDYVRRFIGQDQVVVTRGRDGEVSILLNACSHRGMEICWADQGNQPSFKCPYHGWVFDHAGNLLGAPFEKEMYGDWDKSRYGLKTAHVAIRHGVIFGAFNPICDLDDWMGEFAWYFDQIYGAAEFETLAPAGFGHQIPANWKAAGEQNSGDGYHAITLHHGLVELGIQPQPADLKGWSMDGYDVSSYEGHGLRVAEVAHSVFQSQPAPDEFPVGWFVLGSMFPGLRTGVTASRGGTGLSGPAQQIKTVAYSAELGAIMPRGPNGYTQWRLDLVDRRLPEALKRGMRANTYGSVINADDQEAWPSQTRIAQGAIGAEQPIRYNSMLGPHKPDDWKGPALVHQGVSKDDNQWHFWMRWYDLMTTETQ